MPLWIIISFVIFSAICIFTTVKLARKRLPSYAKSSAAGYIFYSLIFIAVWIFKIDVPGYTLLLPMLAVIITCVFGFLLRLFESSNVFDRYLHAFGTFSASLLAYCILDDFVNTGGSTFFRALFVAFIGNTLGVIFELVEMCHDKKNTYPKSQHGLADTDTDLLFNMIGSALAGAFAFLLIL